jgi:hypothetical protein
MRKADSGGSALSSLLDDSIAGELIPELARHGLQQLIELEVADVLGADRHERTEERFGHCNCYRPRTLITQWAISHCRSPSCAPEASCPRSLTAAGSALGGALAGGAAGGAGEGVGEGAGGGGEGGGMRPGSGNRPEGAPRGVPFFVGCGLRGAERGRRSAEEKPTRSPRPALIPFG